MRKLTKGELAALVRRFKAVGKHGIENTPPDFLELLDHFGDMVDHLLFASDYPHWDADDPDEAFPVAISPELQQKIYADNARQLYRLP